MEKHYQQIIAEHNAKKRAITRRHRLMVAIVIVAAAFALGAPFLAKWLRG